MVTQQDTGARCVLAMDRDKWLLDDESGLERYDASHAEANRSRTGRFDRRSQTARPRIVQVFDVNNFASPATGRESAVPFSARERGWTIGFGCKRVEPMFQPKRLRNFRNRPRVRYRRIGGILAPVFQHQVAAVGTTAI